jgi:hypothetical protein
VLGATERDSRGFAMDGLTRCLIIGMPIETIYA